MAPFNTHLLIAEKIWPELSTGKLDGAAGQLTHFGQFCFGCVACDVDKASRTLTQCDTHFYDRTTDYEFMATSRSATFLARQNSFLVRPFAHLPAKAQAFALGYLCHLCVDEVSKHLWRRRTWIKFYGLQPGSAFAALDEVARHHIVNYEAIAAALHASQVVDAVAPIPHSDLARMLIGVRAFAAAETVEDEFLALVDLFKPDLGPGERRRRLVQFDHEINAARRKTHHFELDRLVRAGVAHTHRRIAELLAGRAPQPDYPELM